MFRQACLKHMNLIYRLGLQFKALPSWPETFLPLDRLYFRRLSLRPSFLVEILGALRACCINFLAGVGRMLLIRLLFRVVHLPCLIL